MKTTALLTRCVFVLLAGIWVVPLHADVIEGVPQDLFALSGTGQSEVAAELRVASSMYDADNIQPCFDQLVKCQSANGELPPAEIILSVLHCMNGDSGAARETLAQVELEHSDSPAYALALARVNRIEGHKIEASALIELAEKRAKDSAWSDERLERFDIQCRTERAGIAESLQQWELASRLLEDVVVEVPNDKSLQLRLARALFQSGSVSAARRRLGEAGNDNVDLVLAQWHAERGEADLAEEVLREAIKSRPESTEIQIALAKYLLDQGSIEQSREVIHGLLENANGDDVELFFMVARLATCEGKWNDAVELLEPLYQANPADVEVAVAFTRSLLATGDPAKIARAVDLAVAKASQRSGRLQTDSTLGWAQLLSGDPAGAEATLMEIASRYKISADTAYFTAQALAANDKLSLAEELVQRAFESTGPFDLRLHAQQWAASLDASQSQPELPFDGQAAIGAEIEPTTD